MCVESSNMSADKDSRSNSPVSTPSVPVTEDTTQTKSDKMNTSVVKHTDNSSARQSPCDFNESMKDKYMQEEEMDLSYKSRDGYTNEESDRSKYLSSPSGNGLKEDGEMAERSLHDIASMARHHRLGLMRNDTVSSETSKLLRGILQGKEKRLVNGGDMSDVSPEEQDMLAKMREGMAMLRSGSFDTDLDSMRSNSPVDMSSQNDSDQEQVGPNGFDENSCTPSEEDDKDKLKDNSEDGGDGGDSVEAKRARVENIITSMRMTGPCYKPLDNLEKRSKRKQYLPQHSQQADAAGMEPSPKMRKMEKDVLRQQLSMMQSQLSEMHSRYMELFTQNYESGQPPMNMAEYQEFMEKKMNGLHAHVEKSAFKSPHPITNLAEVSSEMDPSMFIKQASKLVKEQEHMAKHSPVSPVSGDTPADLEKLAKILKAELVSSVGSLVDNIVAKFAQQKTQQPKTSTPKPPSKPPTPHHNNNNNLPEAPVKETKLPTRMASTPPIDRENASMPKHNRHKITDKIMPPFIDSRFRTFSEMMRNHPPLFPPPPYFPSQLPPAMQPLYPKEPEQTEPLPLVVSTPKKKRTKVTDTRLSPRAARALLQEGSPMSEMEKLHLAHSHHAAMSEGGYSSSLVPVTLPTSVAIPNPSLQHSEVLAMYSHAHSGEHPFSSDGRPMSHSPLIGDHGSPNTAHTPSESLAMAMIKAESEGYVNSFHDHPHFSSMAQDFSADGMQMTTTLTPMHLRKAKLMFFYNRYPSSAILKIYFPDVKFNKNNTAQLVKWFSNFREFYYIQMEKYARQAMAEGVKNAEELIITTDHELYRVLNLHYNRNNQIDVPENFRIVVQGTLREFFKSLSAGKDTEQSWKKAIYKVIARMDDQIPEYFKSPNWMEQLNDL